MAETAQFIYNEATRVHRLGAIIIPSVTQALKAANLAQFAAHDEAAMYRGRAVHLATELLDNGTLDWSTVADQYIPYTEAYGKFKADVRPEIKDIEAIRYSEQYGLCGRIDRLLYIHERLSLLDLKTGTSPEWAGLQLAGYGLLEGMTLPRYSLELSSMGRYSLIKHDDPSDYNTFIGALAVTHWKMRYQGYRVG